MHNIIVTGVSSSDHEERFSVFLIIFLFNMDYILPVMFENFHTGKDLCRKCSKYEK